MKLRHSLLIAVLAVLLAAIPAGAAPKPSWLGLMGINLGMTRQEIEARFGPGVPAPQYAGTECSVMVYPMPDTSSGVWVEYTTRSCRNRSSGWAQSISTRNRFAALPDGVRVNSSIPDPLTRSRWNGYRSVTPKRGYGYQWTKKRWVTKGQENPWWYEIRLAVFAGVRPMTLVDRIQVRYGGRG